MSATSTIEWTDATWNPVRGCVKVSPGCAHCYAETFAERFRGVPGHPYEQGFDLRLVPDKLREPLTWKKPRLVFVNSMSDLFQDGVPDQFIDRVLAVMALAPQHTFQLLTKRADRMRDYMTNETLANVSGTLCAGVSERIAKAMYEIKKNASDVAWPLPNVWLGVSVENQRFADERIPLLLQTPAAVRFISAEPLLGPVDLNAFLYWACRAPKEVNDACECVETRGLDWVIVGGESGHGARPMDISWVRSIVRQCKAAGVPVFVKQLGAKPICEGTGEAIAVFGPRDRKGGDMAEWPTDLKVREYPRMAVPV